MHSVGVDINSIKLNLKTSGCDHISSCALYHAKFKYIHSYNKKCLGFEVCVSIIVLWFSCTVEVACGGLLLLNVWLNKIKSKSRTNWISVARSKSLHSTRPMAVRIDPPIELLQRFCCFSPGQMQRRRLDVSQGALIAIKWCWDAPMFQIWAMLIS